MSFVGNLLSSHTDPNDIKQDVTAQQVGLDQGVQGQQQSLASALAAQAQGQGPSVSGTMLAQQNQQNAANMNAQAAGARGVNAGLAMRQAMQTNAAANQNTAAQAALSRIQEQHQAQGLLGSQLNTMQDQAVHVGQANQAANLGASNINAGIATDNTHQTNQATGGFMSGLAAGVAALNKGGLVQKLADGGFVDWMRYGQFPQQQGQNPWDSKAMAGAGSVLGGKAAGQGGDVDGYSMPEIGSQYGGQAPNLGVQGVSAQAAGASLGVNTKLPSFNVGAMKAGGTVPGHAPVAGDSPENDIVPTMLSPGEIVIPRSVAQHPGFIEALKKHVENLHGEAKGFAAVLAARNKGSR